MFHTQLTPLLLITVFALGCSSGNGDGGTVVGDGNDAALSVATFNAGLAFGFVNQTRERSPLIMAALAATPVDIMCVQEVWGAGDIDALLTTTATRWPNAYNLPPDPTGTSGIACTHEELDPLEACALDQCPGVSPEELATCVVDNCGTEVSGLQGNCVSCLTSVLGQPFDDMRQTCTTGGGSWFADGAFGTAILSAHPVTATDALLLDAHLNRRAVLYNAIDVDGTAHHVFCTHLSPNFTSVPYPAETGTWIEEQSAQIAAMHTFVDSKAGSGGPVILLGDFNNGPAVGDIAADIPENYQAIIDAGYSSPYAESAAPLCTFCGDNPLNTDADHSDSVLIDHVFLRNVPGTVTTERILDEAITVEVGGSPVTSAYSDHYGVAATIAP